MKAPRFFMTLLAGTVLLFSGCGKDGGSDAITYSITVTSGDNGTATANRTEAAEGTTITLTATADVGYEFTGWTVTGGGDIAFSPVATANPATFTMPAANVSIRAEFEYAGVSINGVHWSEYNVGAFGTFVENAEDYGCFYQWNRATAWLSTGDDPVSSPAGAIWDSSFPGGDSWETANDPCPAGWRVPTSDEQATLGDTENVTGEWIPAGVTGYRFTDKASGASIFLPAAGYRRPSGATGNVDSYGRYWSSVPTSSSSGYYLYFSDSSVYPRNNSGYAYGFAVRCVRR